jgi:5-amino-6-(5-phospho-D-ribitylamino)uracil phosphatase
MYRLLAIDIDGTLVNSRDELTPATQAALKRAAESGIHVVLATGRRYSHALPLVEPLGIDVPLVTASGALVKDPIDHRTLFKAVFEPGLLERAVEIVDRCGFDPILCGDTFDEGYEYYYDCDKTRTPELNYYLENNAGRCRRWPGLVENPPPGVYGGFAVGTLKQMSALADVLHGQLPGKFQTNVLHPPRYKGFFTEFSPAGVTKWSAIQRLAHDWGIVDSEICAVGDDVNDIAMICAAGLGVAMGNAQPEVKAVADRIAPGHDEEGVAEVVAWLLAER